MKKQNNPKLTRKLFSILTSMMLMVNGLSVGAFAEDYENVKNYPTTADGEYTNLMDKSAKPTDKVDEFDVTIKVEGKEKTIPVPVDVVFVLDASGSMNSDSKLSTAKNAITTFMDTLVPDDSTNTSIKFGLVTFGENLMNSNIQELTTSKASIISKYPSSASGGTYTQAGLERAATMMGTGTAAHKYIILVSDGAPTYSSKVTTVVTGQSPSINKYGDGQSGNNYGVYRGTAFTGRVGSGNNFRLDGSNQYAVGGITVIDHGFATISSAINIKQTYPIFGIGVGLTQQYSISAANSRKLMQDVSSTYYDVSPANIGALVSTLQSIASSIQGTINNGKLVDPMSIYVDVVDKDESGSIDAGDYTITPYQVGSAGMPGTPTVTYNGVTKAFEITGINLGKGQGFTFTYTVKMKEAYHDNTFYKLNDPTKLYPTGEETPALDINVPEGRVPKQIPSEPAIHLEKTAMPIYYRAVGDIIEYRFAVTNIGNVILKNVTIDDPRLGITGLPVIDELAVGETKIVTANYVITAEDLLQDKITNTATAKGNPPQGEPVTDEDDAVIERLDSTDEIIVNKVNSATGAPLAGAVFRLYQAKSNGDGGYEIDRDKFTEATTDSEGKIIFSGEFIYQHDYDLFLEETFVIFYLEEISAPSGFIRDGNIHQIQMNKFCLEKDVIEPETPAPVSEPAAQLNESAGESINNESPIENNEQPAENPQEQQEAVTENVEPIVVESESSVLAEEIEPQEEQIAEEEQPAVEPTVEDVQMSEQAAPQEQTQDEQTVPEQESILVPENEVPQAEQVQIAPAAVVDPEDQEEVCVEYFLLSQVIVVRNTPQTPGPEPGPGPEPQNPVRPDPPGTTIPDEPTPLAPPEEVVVDAEEVPLAPAEEVDIGAETVPLASVPKTGIGYVDYSKVIGTSYIVTVDGILQDKKKSFKR